MKILIAEWVPSFNKGELAILIGMLQSFKTMGKVKVSIFSLFPSLDKKRYPKDVKLIDIINDLSLKILPLELIEGSKFIKLKSYLFTAFQHFLFIFLYKTFGKKTLQVMKKPLWKEYLESDIIIVGHDQVSCVYGFILFLSPVYITFLAKNIGKPVIVYANGCSEFKGRISKLLANYVLNNCTLITARDEESFFILNRFVRDKKRIHLTADTAILSPPANLERVKTLMYNEKIIDKKRRLLIGVSVTYEVLSNAYPKNLDLKLRYHKAILNIAKIFDLLIDKYHASIIFIPHCVEPYMNRDDRIPAKDIYNIMKNKQDVIVIINEYSPEDLKGLMKEFDIFLGARVHSVINALSMNVPSIVLTRSFDTRASSLIGNMLKQKKYIFNIENLNTDAFFTIISDLLSSSNKIRKDLPSIIEEKRKMALFNGILLNEAIRHSQRKV